VAAGAKLRHVHILRFPTPLSPPTSPSQWFPLSLRSFEISPRDNPIELVDRIVDGVPNLDFLYINFYPKSSEDLNNTLVLLKPFISYSSCVSDQHLHHLLGQSDPLWIAHSIKIFGFSLLSHVRNFGDIFWNLFESRSSARYTPG